MSRKSSRHIRFLEFVSRFIFGHVRCDATVFPVTVDAGFVAWIEKVMRNIWYTRVFHLRVRMGARAGNGNATRPLPIVSSQEMPFS